MSKALILKEINEKKVTKQNVWTVLTLSYAGGATNVSTIKF